MTEVTVEQAMKDLDRWVSLRGSGTYFAPYPKVDPMTIGMLQEDRGIQQVRDELEAFVSVLVSKSCCNSMLEIGLGYFGSTHFLWRLLFDQVITIEKSHDRIKEFGKNMRQFYDKWVFDDGKSSFLIGYSNETNTVMNAHKIAKEGIDVLFIDGDHKYESILTDWLLYAPLVKKGGIVAFHDSAFPQYSGAPQFLDELSKGLVGGKPRTIHSIVKSSICGIAYYLNE